MTDHAWPTEPGEHVWTGWMSKTNRPKPTQYRVCVHPQCHASETRETPRA